MFLLVGRWSSPRQMPSAERCGALSMRSCTPAASLVIVVVSRNMNSNSKSSSNSTCNSPLAAFFHRFARQTHHTPAALACFGWFLDLNATSFSLTAENGRAQESSRITRPCVFACTWLLCSPVLGNLSDHSLPLRLQIAVCLKAAAEEKWKLKAAHFEKAVCH